MWLITKRNSRDVRNENIHRILSMDERVFVESRLVENREVKFFNVSLGNPSNRSKYSLLGSKTILRSQSFTECVR